MKKIIILAITVMLLGIQILIPIDLVQAQETLTDEEAYMIGAVVTASQGGEVQNNPNFFERISQFGNDLVQNAIQNGARMTDIIVRNGQEVMFNPLKLTPVIQNTWRDFAENELTWITGERATIHLGATEMLWLPDEGVIGAPEVNGGDYDIPFFPKAIRIKGTNVGEISMRTIQNPPDSVNWNYRWSTDELVSHNIDRNNRYSSDRLIRVSDNVEPGTWISGIRPASGGTGVDISVIRKIDTVIFYRSMGTADSVKHIPNEEIGSDDEIYTNFTSAFTDFVDEETGELNQAWYTYNMTEILEETTVMNSSYVTNNYIDKSITINEGDTTIIHEADEEGGGTFWRAILSLIETLISTIGGITESIITAIGNIIPSLIEALGNAFIPSENYFQMNFEQINTEIEEKTPDFEPVTEVLSAFDTNDQPAEWDGMSVDLSAYGIQDITIVDSIIIDRYGTQIKTWIRMILLLMTSLVLIKRVSVVMNQ